MSANTKAHANPQPRVFISYRRDDAASAAGRLRDHMEMRFAPECIFMDVDTIEIGANVRATIRAAVLASDVLVAVIGKSWSEAKDAQGRPRLADTDDWVRVEIATALQAGIVVIPVLVDDARMPAARSLPDDLVALLDRNAFEIRNTRFAADINKFLDSLTMAARRAVDAHMARSAVPAVPRAPRAERLDRRGQGIDAIGAAHWEALRARAPHAPAPAAASERLAPRRVAAAPLRGPAVQHRAWALVVVGLSMIVPLGPMLVWAVARTELTKGNSSSFWRDARGAAKAVSILYVALVVPTILYLMLTK